MLPELPKIPTPQFDLYSLIQLAQTPIGEYEIKGISFLVTYWMAVTVVILIFLLVFTLARMRYLYVHWSMGRQSLAFIFWGFVLAVIVEGFLIIGGRTLFTEVIGWKSAPKPIGTALDLGRDRLVNVLGEESEIPGASAGNIKTAGEFMSDFQSLSPAEARKFKNQLCTP